MNKNLFFCFFFFVLFSFLEKVDADNGRVSRIISNAQAGEVTSTTKWQSLDLSEQKGTFVAEFDAVPNDASVHVYTALQDGVLNSFANMSCVVGFSGYDGFIFCRNGGEYNYVNKVAYIAGVKYHFRMEVNVPAHTYNVYVTPAGGAEVQIAKDYLFRNITDKITGWGVISEKGSHTVSNMTFTQTGDTQAPSVPTGLSASSIHYRDFILNWTATTDNVGVVEYEVFKDGVSLGKTASTSMLISGLVANTSYNMTVRARDGVGNWSQQSSVFVAITQQSNDNEAPSVPVGLSYDDVTETSFTFTWDASTDNVGVVEYEVFKDGALIGTTSATSFSVTGLLAQTAYSMTVRARDEVGHWSAQSEELFVSTSVLTGIVSTTKWQSFDMPTVQKGTFTAEYDAVPNATGSNAFTTFQSGTITEYGNMACAIVFYSGGTIVARNGADYVSVSPKVNWIAGKSYHFRVVINVPNHTYNVYVTPEGETEEKIIATNYSFRTEQQSVTQLSGWGIIADAGSHTINNMTFVVPVEDLEVPTSPTNVTANQIFATGCKLSWTASTDNVGVVGYEIFKDGRLWVTSEIPSATVTGLTCNSSNILTIYALDAYGNRSAGATYTVNTSICNTSDPNFFPIAVWYQNTSNAQAYKNIGINMWIYPLTLDEGRINYLNSIDMNYIIIQDATALKHLNDKNLYGWHIGMDEPDNAQWNAKTQSYDPCIDPAIIVKEYDKIKSQDLTRPVYINLGPGVSDIYWAGRGGCKGNVDTYRMFKNGYLNAGDIVSFDIYPANGHYSTGVKGNLWYVPKGVDSLRTWSLDSKPVWVWIETTRIQSTYGIPTANDIKAEVWMALIHGANGVGYYCHSANYEAGLLREDANILNAVTVLNNQIKDLAPVLNSPNIKDYATVSSSNGSTPIDIMTKRYGEIDYIFAVAMNSGETTGTFNVSHGTLVEVIGEGRQIPVIDGKFTDNFSSYGVHLYKIATQTDIEDIIYSDNSELLLVVPNPFRHDTKFTYKIPVSGLVSLKVYDVTGREVVTLANERKSFGEYNVSWDATGFYAGMYFVRMLILPEGSESAIVYKSKILLTNE